MGGLRQGKEGVARVGFGEGGREGGEAGVLSCVWRVLGGQGDKAPHRLTNKHTSETHDTHNKEGGSKGED